VFLRRSGYLRLQKRQDLPLRETKEKRCAVRQNIIVWVQRRADGDVLHT